jgi:hypothetical protein
MPKITIFSAPKPFVDEHIRIIQRNAFQSWLQLGPDVEILLIGEERGLAEVAQEMGIRHLQAVGRNEQGTPLVSSIFELARSNSQSPLLAYVNADILLLPDFVESAERVRQTLKNFLIVGQRWDLDVRQPLDFSEGWKDRLQEQIQQRGKLHPRGGSDYFIYPRQCFVEIPAFAIGRAGWDNWMIFEARRKGEAVVDATTDIQIIHQNHDYSHLPNSQPHYRLPESKENVRLAGGRRTIFTLLDANQRLENASLKPAEMTWRKFWREVEIFPLVKLHNRFLAQLFFAIFHPVKAYYELRAFLAKK